MSREREETAGLGKDRIAAFSDGVFAIAITLLVLDIKYPLADDTPAAQLSARLLHLWPELFSYALSFVIIGVYWVAHHLMLHPLKRIDRTLLWLNILFLMWVALIPCSAGLLGQFRHDRVAVAVYGLNLVLTGLSLQVFWLHITRSRHLTDRPIDPRLVRAGHLRTSGAILIYSIAIGLAFVNSTVSLALYWLVPLSYVLLQSWDDAAHKKRLMAPAQTHTPPDAQTPPE